MTARFSRANGLRPAPVSTLPGSSRYKAPATLPNQSGAQLMEPTIPWYQSAIIRQQIAQVVVALTALFGVNLGGLDVDATLVSVFAGIAAVIAVWTTVTRIFKPAPNLSATAVRKEVAMVKAGDIPPSPTGPGTQRGFFRAALLACVALASAGVALVSMSGCAGTKAAYGAADSLPDTAYVVAEHYAAVVKEAADIAQSPSTPPEV